jgi:hypothetical protein
MARRVNPVTGEQSAEKDDKLDERPPQPGGALGVVQEVTADPTKPVASAARPPPVDAPPPPPVRRYRVEAHKQVLYSGSMVAMRPGKVLEESQYDIDLLRRQGLQLKEIT